MLASNSNIQLGALAGASGGATVGVGGAANLLFGGSERGISLQPLSTAGSTGLNIGLGVGGLGLELAS